MSIIAAKKQTQFADRKSEIQNLEIRNSKFYVVNQRFNKEMQKTIEKGAFL